MCLLSLALCSCPPVEFPSSSSSPIPFLHSNQPFSTLSLHMTTPKSHPFLYPVQDFKTTPQFALVPPPKRPKQKRKERKKRYLKPLQGQPPRCRPLPLFVDEVGGESGGTHPPTNSTPLESFCMTKKVKRTHVSSLPLSPSYSPWQRRPHAGWTHKWKRGRRASRPFKKNPNPSQHESKLLLLQPTP